ncbi:unnamed protein product [Malus baccata var. baccata]
MSVGAETLLVCVWRFLKLSMKTSSLCVRRHPFISATLLFFYLFYVFFNLFVFWFPFLVCIVVLVRLFYTSGGLAILEEAKRDEKPSTDDRLSCKKPDHPVGGDGVVNRDGCSLMKQKSRRTNVSRRCIEASGQDYYNVGKGISISKTPKDSLIGGTALIDRSKKAIMEEKRKCGFDEGESSTVKASAEENIQALVEQHRSVLDSDISESQLLSSDDSDEQPDKSKGGGTNGEEMQEDGNKAVQWTDDDQRNLMDLGLSEIERNKRLESLIARRRARKLFKMQVEKGLIDLDTIIPGQIAPIFVAKNTPFDYAKLFSRNLDTPGSAPPILLPMQNPFDLPYDPHEEKPNLMADSFQQEFTTVHQKEMLFCRHESFSSGAASYPLEPKRKSLDGLGFSGFKKLSETGAHDKHIERMLSGKHDEVIEALLSMARNNMSDIGSNADTAESRTESPLIESPIPAISSVKPKDEGNSETQRLTDTKATNKMESKSVEMESHVTDDSNDESSSTSYSEDDEQSFHSTRPGPSQNAGSKVRHFPPKPLNCSIPMSKSVKELLYDSSPSANKMSRLEERLFYSERGTCHTPTYSIASDLQVEVSEAGSPSLTDNAANSPSDKESEMLDGNFEKEYMWTASPQSSRTEENESKLRDACGLSEKDLASIRFSGSNKNIKDSSESSSMHMQHLDELHDVCSLSSSITDLYGDIQTHSMGYNGKCYDDVRQAVKKVGKLRTSSSCTVLLLENQDETTKSNENLVTHSSAKLEEPLNPLDETTKKVNTPAINAANLKDEMTNADRDGGDQILIKQETGGESSKPKEVTILVSSRHSEEIFANPDERDVSLDTKQLIKGNKNSNYTEGDLQQETENEDKKELDAKKNSNPIQGRKDDQRTAESRVYSDRIPSVVQKDLVNEDVVVASNYLSSSSSLTSVSLEDIPRDQASSSNSNPERHIGVSESKVGGNVKSDSSTMKPHDSALLTPQTAVQPVEESTTDRSNKSYSKKSQEQCKPTEKSEGANIILTEQAEEIGDLSQKTREAASELKKQAAEIEKISGKAKEAAAELKKPVEETGNLSQKATDTILELKKSAEEIESMSQKAREVAAEMKIPAEEIVKVSQKAAETAELKKPAEEIESVSQKATQPAVESKKPIEEIESATQKATVALTKLIKPGEAIKEAPEKTTRVDAELKQSVKAASNVSQKATETAARSKIAIEKIEDALAKTTKVEAEITKPAEQTGNISQKTIEAASELKKQGDEIGSVSTKEVGATAKVKKPAEEIGSVLCKATEAPVVLKISSEEVGIISQKASEAPAILKHPSEEIANVSQKASETTAELKKTAEEIESVSQKASKAATESRDLTEKVENVPRKKIEVVAELKNPAEENGNISTGVAVEVEKPVKVRSESQRATEATVELKKSAEEVGSASQKEMEARVASKKSSEEIESGSQKLIEAPEKIKHPVEELETEASARMKETDEKTGSVPTKATEKIAGASQKAVEIPRELKKSAEETGIGPKKSIDSTTELKKPAKESKIASQKTSATELKQTAKESEATIQKQVEISRELKRPMDKVNDLNCIYRNPNEPIEARVKDLLSRMTLREKAGQMTQIERQVSTPEAIRDFSIGSILSAGGSVPFENALSKDWADMVDGFQRSALENRLGIPMIYGIDAVHGNNSVYGATIFPHNVGLGASRDADLAERIGAATALEVRASGIHYTFAPCVAVCKDPRWGRCYESFSEDTEIVRKMTTVVTGLQGQPPEGHPKGYPFVMGRNKTIACAKHFVGDGGTHKGLNEGNTISSYEDLERIHVAPYLDCISQGVSTVMASYSSWNGSKLHADRFLLTEVLKDKLGFKGFVISDWEALDRLCEPQGSDYRFCISSSVNAGVDMVMVPFRYEQFVEDLVYLVEHGEIPMSRIDDAVERILRVKFVASIFEHPFSDRSLLDIVGCKLHRDLAREAVRKSLVMLKNGKDPRKPFLPLDRKVKRILVTGTHADDLGYQCGGWTATWDGRSGRITIGTTVLEAIKKAVGDDTEIIYELCPSTETLARQDISFAVVAVGEGPYAEFRGDNLTLVIPFNGADVISSVADRFPTLVILISGRPLTLEPQLLEKMDALVAAWLPGSEGEGITDVIFGDYDFEGRLPVSWFKSVEQLPMNARDNSYDPLYPLGFGLTYNKGRSLN